MITLRWNSQASTCKPFCTEQTGLHQVWDMDSQIHTPNGTKNAARSFPAQVWYIWESQTHTPNKACFFFGTWFFCLFFLVTCFFSFYYRSLLCFLNTVAQSHEKLWHCTGTFGCEKTMFPWQESHESDEISKTCVKFEEITWQNEFWKFTPLYSIILKTISNSKNVGFKTTKPHFSFFLCTQLHWFHRRIRLSAPSLLLIHSYTLSLHHGYGHFHDPTLDPAGRDRRGKVHKRQLLFEETTPNVAWCT